MAASDDLLDRQTLRQTRWVRYATGVSRLALTRLREGDAALEGYIRVQLDRLNTTTLMLSKEGAERLARMLRRVRGISREAFTAILEILRSAIYDAGLTELDLEARDVARALPTNAQPSRPERRAARSMLSRLVVNGVTLAKGVRAIQRGRVETVARTIQDGIRNNLEPSGIASRLFGTRRLAYADGAMQQGRRSLDQFVKDAIHTATSRAQEFFRRINRRFFIEEMWTATLDTQTCPICFGRDGQRFPVGEGPQPPAHPRCRCSRGVRLKGDGPLQRQTFGEWIERQSAEDQREVLGPSRYRLWKEGKVGIKEFAADGRVLTLDELRRREGLDVADLAA